MVALSALGGCGRFDFQSVPAPSWQGPSAAAGDAGAAGGGITARGATRGDGGPADQGVATADGGDSATAPVPVLDAGSSTPVLGILELGSQTMRGAADVVGPPDHFDLTACDVTIDFAVDLTGLRQDRAGATPLIEVGLREPGAPLPSPGGRGGWIAVRLGDLATDPGTLDIDDKFVLQAQVGADERDYDVLAGGTAGTPFGTYVNYGIWFDRDGVDPWQADHWGAVDGGNYDTAGVYEVRLIYRSVDARRSTLFATVNGVAQGFYAGAWRDAEPDYHPAGLAFDADLSQLDFFIAYQGAVDVGGEVRFSSVTVSGCRY